MGSVERLVPRVLVPRVLVLFVLAAVSGAVSPSLAHEYHASLAEVDFNPESGNLEVALRVIPEDLEAALSAGKDREVRLEATEGVDELIRSYLEGRFRLLDPEGKARPLLWVGKEVSHKAAWLYFEVPVDPRVEWRLENRVLFDLEPGQVNTVLLRVDGETSTWTFSAGSGAEKLPPLPPRAHR